jgi:hypothetical protein
MPSGICTEPRGPSVWDDRFMRKKLSGSVAPGETSQGSVAPSSSFALIGSISADFRSSHHSPILLRRIIAASTGMPYQVAVLDTHDGHSL